MTCGRPINRELPKVLSEVWKTETRSRCVHIYGLIDVKKADAAEAMLHCFAGRCAMLHCLIRLTQSNLHDERPILRNTSTRRDGSVQYSREWAGQLACRKVIDLLTLMIEYTNEGEAALLIQMWWACCTVCSFHSRIEVCKLSHKNSFFQHPP